MLFLITDRMLRWRRTLEYCDLDIEYIQCTKYIVADTLSILTFNGNQDSTQESAYKHLTVSEINDTKKPPEVIFSY